MQALCPISYSVEQPNLGWFSVMYFMTSNFIKTYITWGKIAPGLYNKAEEADLSHVRIFCVFLTNLKTFSLNMMLI